MKKTKKQINAVRLMRALRDSLSEQMQHMTFEQQHRFIADRIRAPHLRATESR